MFDVSMDRMKYWWSKKPNSQYCTRT